MGACLAFAVVCDMAMQQVMEPRGLPFHVRGMVSVKAEAPT